MWPKEHGTYGEIGFPLLTALVIGEPTLVAWALLLASLAAYCAHEPMLVLYGVRGERRRRAMRGRAWRWLGATGGAALLVGGLGFLYADDLTRLAVLVPLLLSIAALSFALRRAERTLAGEFVAGAALVSASVPVSVASGWTPTAALLVASLWLTSFGLMTLTVRGVARVRLDSGASLTLAKRVLPVVLICCMALLGLGLLPAWAVLVLVPTWLAGTLLVARPPSPRHMRRVGWSLIGTSVLTFGALLAAMPAPT